MPVVMYELGIIDSPQEELNKLHVKKKPRGKRKTAIGRPPLGDG